MTTAASPCTKVCTIHPATGLCIGCLRTLDEIAAWGGMTDAERRTVMAGLAERRALLPTPGACAR